MEDYTELQKTLKATYPKFFKLFWEGSPQGTAFWGCQVWGMECGPGWLPLVAEAASRIEPLINALPEEEQENCYVVQTKEKWGGLRIYLSCGTDAMYNILSEIEEKSYQTCEECGKPGILRQQGWWKTTCEEHKK